MKLLMLTVVAAILLAIMAGYALRPSASSEAGWTWDGSPSYAL